MPSYGVADRTAPPYGSLLTAPNTDGLFLSRTMALCQPADSLQICAAMRSELTGSPQDRKSTRLNSSHVKISYAVFCLKKKKIMKHHFFKFTRIFFFARKTKEV